MGTIEIEKIQNLLHFDFFNYFTFLYSKGFKINYKSQHIYSKGFLLILIMFVTFFHFSLKFVYKINLLLMETKFINQIS